MFAQNFLLYYYFLFRITPNFLRKNIKICPTTVIIILLYTAVLPQPFRLSAIDLQWPLKSDTTAELTRAGADKLPWGLTRAGGLLEAKPSQVLGPRLMPNQKNFYTPCLNSTKANPQNQKTYTKVTLVSYHCHSYHPCRKISSTNTPMHPDSVAIT